MNFEKWLKRGYDKGWVGPPVCASHDGVPMTEAEYEDDEPCVHIIRLYATPEEKVEVEESHAPSVWRASNRGWK